MLPEPTIKILNAFGIDYKPEVKAQKGNKNTTTSMNWINEGEKYGHELDLLNIQLRAKSKEEIKTISESFTEEADNMNPNPHAILISKILKAYTSQKNRDSCIDWSQLNNLLINIELEKEVFYGIALSMTRENNVEGAINSINRLLDETQEINPDQKHEILTRFLSLYCDCMPAASEASSPKEWDNHINIHLVITKVLKCMNNNYKNSTTKTSVSIT